MLAVIDACRKLKMSISCKVAALVSSYWSSLILPSEVLGIPMSVITGFLFFFFLIFGIEGNLIPRHLSHCYIFLFCYSLLWWWWWVVFFPSFPIVLLIWLGWVHFSHLFRTKREFWFWSRLLLKLSLQPEETKKISLSRTDKWRKVSQKVNYSFV